MRQKINISLLLLVILSSVLISITMFRSGLKYSFGLGFWGPNGHDAIWHLSLINQASLKVPPQNPIFSGTILTNYHWGFDFLIALLSKITNIDSSFLYFQILPLIFALLIGFLSYKLAFLLTKNKITSLFFVFLNYFAGSFGWLVTLFRDHQIGGESLFWSMQSASILLNPPYALSIILLLIGLILWLKYQPKNSVSWAIVIGLIFGLITGIKIYGAILIGLSLSLFFIQNLFSSKKTIKFNLVVCVTTALISFLILFGLGVISTNQLEFKPFWFNHSLIESVDKLYWPKLASFRLNKNNIFFLILIEVFLTGVFLIGNLGLRFLGFFSFTKKNNKSPKNFKILILYLFLISFLIPSFFVQKGTAWNTIQFFYYFLIFANFYFAVFLSKLWQKYKILSIVLLLLSSVTSFSTLKDYFGNPPPSALPNPEIEALSFLKKQPYGYVLTYPYNAYAKENMSTPIPLYAYETTAYVSAFSQKPVFLEDEMNLNITGFDWKNRRIEEEKFFDTDDKFFTRGFLLNNQIDYVYLLKDQNFKVSIEDLQIDSIFQNDEVKIFKVRK
ncbi:MAG: hypothetical protein PHX34_04945 [Candidatus Shapirobacteria bacterium]|nr:hypothetical protein [Candidatus Shapirobacteria bacterium]